MANISQNVNIEMLEKLPDGSYKKKHPETKASQVKLEDTAGNFEATELEGSMNELFTNVSNGKDLVGGAITDVDDSIVIPADPTFNDLASAISGISTGKKWATGELRSGIARLMTVDGLDFKPSIIITTAPGYNALSIYWEVFSKTHQWWVGSTSVYRWELSSFDGYVVDGGFSIRGAGNELSNIVWIAVE